MVQSFLFTFNLICECLSLRDNLRRIPNTNLTSVLWQHCLRVYFAWKMLFILPAEFWLNYQLYLVDKRLSHTYLRFDFFFQDWPNVIITRPKNTTIHILLNWIKLKIHNRLDFMLEFQFMWLDHEMHTSSYRQQINQIVIKILYTNFVSWFLAAIFSVNFCDYFVFSFYFFNQSIIAEWLSCLRNVSCVTFYLIFD